MSRSGYSDDCEYLDLYRGTVLNAIRGRRGQAFLRSLVAALDAMPVKRLIAGDIDTPEGEVCALGCLARANGVAMETLDSDDHQHIGKTFNIATQLAAEVMYENDDGAPYRGHKAPPETPEERWQRMRMWAAKQIDITEDELLPEPTP